MTNREKFEEVFNLKMDDHPAGICLIIDSQVCDICGDECPAFNFWDREWKKEDTNEQQTEEENSKN